MNTVAWEELLYALTIFNTYKIRHISHGHFSRERKTIPLKNDAMEQLVDGLISERTIHNRTPFSVPDALA